MRIVISILWVFVVLLAAGGLTGCPAREECSLGISVQGTGTTEPGVGIHKYDKGATVQVTAIAGSGWIFDHWEGGLTGSVSPTTLVMDSDKSVVAVFKVDPATQHTLNVTVIGIGTVTLDPPGGTYDEGTVVTLTPAPSSGWSFDHWEWDLTGSTTPATIMMDADKTVVASFVNTSQVFRTLTINTNGSGAVITNPAVTRFSDGSQVTLTAYADHGWRFERWEGDLTGDLNPATLTMNANKLITAVFVQNDLVQYSMNVELTGQGTVTLNPPGGVYTEGSLVALTALAASGWHFDHWEGDADGDVNPKTFVMSSDKNVTAVFVQNPPGQYTLTIETAGAGTVVVEPMAATYTEGSTITLTPSAETGWHFVRWEGGLTGSANPAQLTMDENKAVTAVFGQNPPPCTLTINAIGQGSVVLDPPGGTYEQGTAVTMTPRAAPAWRFDHWEGDVTGNADPVDIVMDGNKAVASVFEGAIGDAPFDTTVIFDNHNEQEAQTGSAESPEVHLGTGALVTTLFAWHPAGVNVDNLSIQAEDGTVYGPWTAVTDANNGAVVQWKVTPNLALPAGLYTVLDSSETTWFHNSGSNGAGFARMEGVSFGETGSGTIGSNGGELNAADLHVTIPPGAFAEDATLTVDASGNTGDTTLTGAYILSGIPEVYGAFSIEMAVPGEPDGATLVSLGSPGYLRERGLTTVDTAPIPATIEDGVLRFEVPAATDTGKRNSKQAAGPRWIYARNEFRGSKRIESLLSSGGHFRLYGNHQDFVNPTYQPQILTLADNLETAFTNLTQQLNLPFRRTAWPITVRLDWFWFDVNHAYAHRSSSDVNSDSMEFNLYSVTDSSLATVMRAAAIHELFHVLQYNYVRTANGAGDQDWLMDASSTWSEWLMCDNSHYPDVIQGNEGLFELNGILDATNTEARDASQKRNSVYHGYSSSLFVRYLVESHSAPAIGAIWNGLGNGMSAPAALNAAVASWPSDWQTFCRDAYSGGLQRWRVDVGRAEMQVRTISDLVRAVRPLTVARVDDESDMESPQYAAGPLPPVSATLYQIEVTHRPLTPGDNVVYFAPEGLTADTCVQVRWFNPKPRNASQWTSTVLGEVQQGVPLQVDLRTISDLPDPFVFQLITTNRSITNGYPQAGVRWAFGSVLDGLRAMDRGQGLQIWVDSSDMVESVDCSPPSPIVWTQTGASSHLETHHTEGSQEAHNYLKTDHVRDFQCTMDPSGMWIESLTLSDNETTVMSVESFDHTWHLQTIEQGRSTSLKKVPLLRGYKDPYIYLAENETAGQCLDSAEKHFIVRLDGVEQSGSWRITNASIKRVKSVSMSFFK